MTPSEMSPMAGMYIHIARRSNLILPYQVNPHAGSWMTPIGTPFLGGGCGTTGAMPRPLLVFIAVLITAPFEGFHISASHAHRSLSSTKHTALSPAANIPRQLISNKCLQSTMSPESVPTDNYSSAEDQTLWDFPTYEDSPATKTKLKPSDRGGPSPLIVIFCNLPLFQGPTPQKVRTTKFEAMSQLQSWNRVPCNGTIFNNDYTNVNSILTFQLYQA